MVYRSIVCLCVLMALTTISMAYSGAYGPTCSGCHATPQAGKLSVTGNSGTANPVEAAGKPDGGTLPVYIVTQGGTTTLKAQVSNWQSGGMYAVLLEGFDSASVTSSANNVINFTPDPTWTYASGSPSWYYTPNQTFGGTATMAYNMTVSPTTPVGYYEMSFLIGGPYGTTSTPFYVDVIPEPMTVVVVAVGAGAVLLRRRR